MTRRLLPALLLVLAACDGGGPIDPPAAAPACVGAPAAAHLPAPPASLDAAFEAAGAEFGVPADLLRAIAFVETRVQMVRGLPGHGREARSGVMALGEGVLPRAAARAGVSGAEARTRPEANIRAAAALLSAWADELAVRRADLGAWAPVVARYGALPLAAAREAYVHDDVYGALRSGFSLPAATLHPRDVRPLDPRPARSRSGAAAPDQADARWVPSPNFDVRPPGERAAMVVIHTCEGAYTGCWSWLASPQSGVSAHYVVREDGGEITQLVRESDRAWHIGARYQCALNAGHACERDGQPANDFTIGIEHAGYASQTAWPEAQIAASARLVCAITRRHGIPPERVHVVAHGQLQPHNRSDPGAGWPWADYLARIARECGDGAGEGKGEGAEIVIDSDNALNRREAGYFEASGAWIGSTAAAGFFGSGYRFAPARPLSDPADFHFFLPEAGVRTVDAWWTAAPDRSPRAPFIVQAADGRELAVVERDQQRDGGRWNELGTWAFPAGWNRIRLSRWTAEGCVVVADAVRIR